MMMGYTLEQIHRLTKIDRWFLEKLKHIIDINRGLEEYRYLSECLGTMDRYEFLELIEEPAFVKLLHEAKIYGFSDFQIARAVGLEADMNMEDAGLMIRRWRYELNIIPVINKIDTLAAEYPAQTNYLYMSYL